MVIADTGFWVALADRKDRHHAAAHARFRALTEAPICTWPVVAETCHMLLHRMGPRSQQKFLDSCAADAFEIFELSREHFPRLLQLLAKYADLPMDLADASLVLLAEHLGHGRILSTDRRDFQTYRFKNHHPFENLLLP